MSEVLIQSAFFGVFISILGYEIGIWLRKKTKLALFNPLLVSIIVVIVTLLLLKVDYASYNQGAKYISYLLTPATVCLAIPLYQQLEVLKKNKVAILCGITSGCIASLSIVFFFALIFQFNHTEYVTLLPKSITTAIGMGVSDELEGIVTITVAVIIITGIFGNLIGETVFRIFHIKEKIAKGVALGTAAHAIGTAKAMELGEVEGAMSSLSIVVSGIITVIGASVYANFL